MNITFNNIPSASATSFVSLSDIPQIVKVEDTTVGTYSRVKFTIDNGSSWKAATTADTQWVITFLGETISNVLEPQNATNRNFLVTTNGYSTAVSIMNALRNCPTLTAKFNIYMSRNASDTNAIILDAREVGQMWIDLETDLQMTNGMTQYMNYTALWGTDTSELWNSKLSLDIYSNDKYVTTLSKNFYGSECAWDVAPVIATISEREKTIPFDMYISSTNASGITTNIGTISGNSVSQGYLVNQGFKYIPLGTLPNNFMIAQNYSRGRDKSWDNNSVLYVYGNTIPISWYSKTLTSITVTITYLSSAYRSTSTATTTVTDNSNGWLHNGEVTLNQVALNNSFYVKLEVKDGANTLATIGYNIIKPIKMTEYYQRIYFRNSYGGISFVDETGSKSETRDVETTTFNKNVYDFYTQDKNEQSMIYNNEVNYSVTLKTHLIEKDGTYIFNDLMQSQEVWTEINGETYGIIIDSVSVEEDNRNDIYTATVKYHYSQKTSL